MATFWYKWQLCKFIDFELHDRTNNTFHLCIIQDYYASYDFVDGDGDPSPSTSSDSHGTSCAGEIAMVKNSQCGIGVAYKSKVASEF